MKGAKDLEASRLKVLQAQAEFAYAQVMASAGVTNVPEVSSSSVGVDHGKGLSSPPSEPWRPSIVPNENLVDNADLVDQTRIYERNYEDWMYRTQVQNPDSKEPPPQKGSKPAASSAVGKDSWHTQGMMTVEESRREVPSVVPVLPSFSPSNQVSLGPPRDKCGKGSSPFHEGVILSHAESNHGVQGFVTNVQGVAHVHDAPCGKSGSESKGGFCHGKKGKGKSKMEYPEYHGRDRQFAVEHAQRAPKGGKPPHTLMFPCMYWLLWDFQRGVEYKTGDWRCCQCLNHNYGSRQKVGFGCCSINSCWHERCGTCLVWSDDEKREVGHMRKESIRKIMNMTGALHRNYFPWASRFVGGLGSRMVGAGTVPRNEPVPQLANVQVPEPRQVPYVQQVQVEVVEQHHEVDQHEQVEVVEPHYEVNQQGQEEVVEQCQEFAQQDEGSSEVPIGPGSESGVARMDDGSISSSNSNGLSRRRAAQSCVDFTVMSSGFDGLPGSRCCSAG